MVNAMHIDFVCGGCHKRVGVTTTASDLRAGNTACPKCGRRVTRSAGDMMANVIEDARKPVSEMTPRELGISRGQAAAAEGQRMLFGKYRGRTLLQILHDDPCYIDWLNGLELSNKALKTAVAVMCDVHATEIEKAIEDKRSGH